MAARCRHGVVTNEAQHVHLGTAGVNMEVVPGSPDRESWMARAVRVVPAVAQQQQTEALPSVRAEPAAWDPFEVWLHRIHQPRQQRAAKQ